MSRSIPSYLTITLRLHVTNVTMPIHVNGDNSTVHGANMTNQSHSSFMQVYGANLAIMVLPLLAALFLISVYSRHRANLNQRSFMLPCFSRENDDKNEDTPAATLNMAVVNQNIGKQNSNLKVRKPMFTSGRLGKFRYHEQQQNQNGSSQCGSNNLDTSRNAQHLQIHSVEVDDAYLHEDAFAVIYDSASDEESNHGELIDLQEKSSTYVLSNNNLFPSLSISLSSLNSSIASSTSTTLSTLSTLSQQQPHISMDDTLVYKMMQSMAASLTFQAWLATDVDTDNDCCDIETETVATSESTPTIQHHYSVHDTENLRTVAFGKEREQSYAGATANLQKKSMWMWSMWPNSVSTGALSPNNSDLESADNTIVSTGLCTDVVKKLPSTEGDETLAHLSRPDLVTIFDTSPSSNCTSHMMAQQPSREIKRSRSFGYSLRL